MTSSYFGVPRLCDFCQLDDSTEGTVQISPKLQQKPSLRDGMGELDNAIHSESDVRKVGKWILNA